jgi:hypothetical protein
MVPICLRLLVCQVFITPLTAQESKDTSSTGGGGSRDSLVVAPGQRVLSKSVLGGSSTNLLQPSSKTQSASAAVSALRLQFVLGVCSTLSPVLWFAVIADSPAPR